MHRLPENIILLSLRQGHSSTSIKNILGPTPTFLDFKNSDIFTQTLPKRPYQTAVVIRFREMYAPTSRKYVSTEAKTKIISVVKQKKF